MKSNIPYTKPSITSKEIEYATDAVKTGWGSSCYEYINRFEKQFGQYTGAKYCIATSSCTGALHMGLAALGIGSGDEVILADTNWIATVAPVTYLNATPVFVDIREDTWCLAASKVEEAISSKTKAIIAVHLYGNLCEMDKLIRLGEKYNIPVIEDSAEALGSFWHNKHAGTVGTFGTFSFHGTKTMTTGEGGMFITNDQLLYEKVLTLSNHGRSRLQKKQFWPDEIGFKYKMSNIQAAIGCAQIERINDLVQRKRDIFYYYFKNLHSLNGLSMNPEVQSTINSYWMPTIVFAKETKISQQMALEAYKKENIDARVFFHPLSSLDMFDVQKNVNAYCISSRAINLPSYHDIQQNEQDRVIEVIKKFYEQ